MTTEREREEKLKAYEKKYYSHFHGDKYYGLEVSDISDITQWDKHREFPHSLTERYTSERDEFNVLLRECIRVNGESTPTDGSPSINLFKTKRKFGEYIRNLNMDSYLYDNLVICDKEDFTELCKSIETFDDARVLEFKEFYAVHQLPLVEAFKSAFNRLCGGRLCYFGRLQLHHEEWTRIWGNYFHVYSDEDNMKKKWDHNWLFARTSQLETSYRGKYVYE